MFNILLSQIGILTFSCFWVIPSLFKNLQILRLTVLCCILTCKRTLSFLELERVKNKQTKKAFTIREDCGFIYAMARPLIINTEWDFLPPTPILNVTVGTADSKN